MRTLFSPRWRWLTITVLWLAVVLLAQWGLLHAHPRPSVWNRLYLVPDIFSMGISDNLAAQDWRIQTARFIGPLVFATTFFTATAIVFRDQWHRVRLRFVKGHVVVAGLGDKGSRLAASFAEGGRRVVAVDPDPTNPNAAGLRRRGVVVLTGDARDRAVLVDAGLARADDLVAITDGDGTNAEVLDVARGVRRADGRPPLSCAVHLVDPQLSRLLRTRELQAAGHVRFDFFNIYQRGARLWLADADPFRVDGEPRLPHLVIVGLDPLGETLVVAAVQRWVALDPEAPALVMTLIDPDATRAAASLRLRHPALAVHARIDAIDVDLDRPTEDDVASVQVLAGKRTVTAVFVCIDDDTRALTTALSMRELLGDQYATVHVRTRFNSGLALLVDDASEVGQPVQLQAFGLLDRTCTAEAVTEGTNVQVARALHEDYVARARASGRTGPAVRPWEELTRQQQEANRAAADSLVASLHAIGCELRSLYAWDERAFTLTDDDVESLAKAEHARWSAERRADGWQYGPVRDDVKKLHPDLAPWSERTEQAKDFDRAAARALPTLLARSGFEVYRPSQPRAAPAAPHRGLDS
jgi:hypothetical protein